MTAISQVTVGWGRRNTPTFEELQDTRFELTFVLEAQSVTMSRAYEALVI